jgi:hypothetical protein
MKKNYLVFSTLNVFKLLWGGVFLLFGMAETSAQDSTWHWSCGMGEFPVEGLAPNCGHTSPYWSSDQIHIPDPNADPITIPVNLIFIQNAQGEGNFKQGDTLSEMFLNDLEYRVNLLMGNLVNDTACLAGYIQDTKIRYDFNRIYIQDDFYWNNDNCTNLYCCPNTSNWYLHPLDTTIQNNLEPCNGINVYFTTDGSLYNDLVVNQVNCDFAPSIGPWCSEFPSPIDLTMGSRIHLGDVWLKLWHFKNCYTLDTFPITYFWSLEETRDGLAHEIGHSLWLLHNYNPLCSGNNLMDTLAIPRNYLEPLQIGIMHRALSTTSVGQYPRMDETFVVPRIVSTDETWDLNMRLFSDVIVESGATLRITCILRMPENGRIIVERGARVIVDGGTITRAVICEDKRWYGIEVQGNNNIDHNIAMRDESTSLTSGNPGIALIINDARIEYSENGVYADAIDITWPTVQEFRNGFIYAENSTFSNNVISSFFMKDDPVSGPLNTNYSAFINCDFLNEDGSADIGIKNTESDNVLVEGCFFDNMNDNAIVAEDAGMTIKSNTFLSNGDAIHATASMPMIQPMSIGGHTTADGNLFDSNFDGVYALGLNKLRVSHNYFIKNYIGCYAEGSSKYRIDNNTFDGDFAGIGNVSTGTPKKEADCNYYDVATFSIYNQGDNRGLKFHHEYFWQAPHDVYLTDIGAIQGQLSSQGSLDNAIWNMFTSGSQGHISTVGNTQSFNYWHPSPTIHPSLQPLCSWNNNGGCAVINNYLSQETDGGQAGCLDGYLPDELMMMPELCTELPCLMEIMAQIEYLNQANSDEDLADDLNDHLSELTWQRDNIADVLISQWFSARNYDSIEMVLNLLNTTDSRRELYALKAQLNLLDEAVALLEELPESSTDDIYFKDVQRINLRRLDNSNEFDLTDEDEATLNGVAESNEPSAGYAKALLGLLTGRYFDPIVPEIASDRNASIIKEDYLLQKIMVSPNPAKENITIQIDVDMIRDNNEIKIYNATGLLVKKLKTNNTGIIVTDVSEFNEGIYFVVLFDNDKLLSKAAFVVNK